MGYSFNSLHKRVDRTIARILFRARHEAERHLARVAAGLPHTTARATVAHALVLEPLEALHLSSAALFRRHGERGDFRRGEARGWNEDTIKRLSVNEPLVLRLDGERGPMRLHGVGRNGEFPRGNMEPILALPIFIREQLEAFVLYGAHADGGDVDPDELASLHSLCVAAAAAYDHADAQEMRAKVEELQRRVSDQAKVIQRLTGSGS